METEISPDYLPITPSSLRTNTTVGCDIFLLAKTTAEIRFVLYCRGDAIFDETKKDVLIAQKIKSLFIKKGDQEVFFEYLENNFMHIISDESIPPDERSKVVHGAATNLVKDLFNDPKTGTVERSKAFAHNMVDYVIKDSIAAENLLNLAVHEYHTYTHSVNVAAIGTLFGQGLGLGVKELKGLCAGILLHDVGKTRISADILNKPGKLTKEEFEIVKKHPELGMEVLEETGVKFKEERIVTLQHHENDDGSGYPYGLKKDEIHPCGKIARVIDVYDALTARRPYADAVRPFAALVEMRDEMLHCFDTEVLKEFIRFLGPYDQRQQQRKDGTLIT